jgi:hypothetical protein
VETQPTSLYERLGGVYNIATVVDDSHRPRQSPGPRWIEWGFESKSTKRKPRHARPRLARVTASERNERRAARVPRVVVGSTTGTPVGVEAVGRLTSAL